MFKYLPPERIDILKNNLICFNNPINFNDPFEFKTLFDLKDTKNNIIREFLKIDLLKQLPPEFKLLISHLDSTTLHDIISNSQIMTLDFLEREKDTVYKIYQESLSTLNKSFIEMTRVLSLSETPDNILMWGHYASAHHGFVIELDVTHPFFNQRRSEKDEYGFLRKVKYQCKLPLANLQSENPIEHFIIKNQDWSYEKEWRMLLPESYSEKTISHENKSFSLYKIPPETITRIIIGCNASDDFKKEIKSIISDRKNYQHVSVQFAKCSNNEFKLLIE